jgi:hemolysin activation/secretion protein
MHLLFKSIFKLIVAVLTISMTSTDLKAQTVNPQPLPQDLIRPDRPPSPLPAPEEIPPSPSLPVLPEEELPNLETSITVTGFRFTGNTVFTSEELAQKFTDELINRTLPLSRLLQIASDVSRFYDEQGYITSSAVIYLLPSTQKTGIGIVEIQIIEGELEDIEIVAAPGSSKRLNSSYTRSRIALGTFKPFNIKRLQETLQLLQLDPLIDKVSVTLKAGSTNGKNILEVAITEAPTFTPQIVLDNDRSPSVGTFRRGIGINEANLLGLGDNIRANYSNSDGSNALDVLYTVPINPRNGTIGFAYYLAESDIIEAPFNELDIESSARLYELTLRQPLLQSIKEQTYREFTLGLTGSFLDSQGLISNETPFPSLGADENGRTRVSALRFFQEFTQRNSLEVLAFRSQFNVGLDALDSTINDQVPNTEPIPDSTFFSWKGQGQYIRLLAPETLVILRADLQLAGMELLPAEQFALGGVDSVRGYRQDFILSDSGVFLSAEVLVPIIYIGKDLGVVQIAPFIDGGTTWNSFATDNLNPETIWAIGIGLQLRLDDRFTARLDWGIPLVNVNLSKRTWQENGIYFSIQWIPF